MLLCALSIYTAFKSAHHQGDSSCYFDFLKISSSPTVERSSRNFGSHLQRDESVPVDIDRLKNFVNDLVTTLDIEHLLKGNDQLAGLQIKARLLTFSTTKKF